MPNGANWYQLKEISEKNPKSFKALSFPFLETEKERDELLRRINIELTSPGSEEKCVYSLIVNDENLLTPVAENTFPITAPEDSFRWKEFKMLNFRLPDKDDKIKLKNYSDPLVPIVSPFYQSEPEVATLGFPWLNSIIEAEYIAKAGFIEACLNNQWLIPYANRLSWRYVDGNASIIVPYWKYTDLDNWHKMEYKSPSKNGFLMSDGKRYPYPPDMKIEHSDVFTDKKNVLNLEGSEFDARDALVFEYPKINRKQRSVSRIIKEIGEGLIPFDPPYPIAHMNDSEQRIKAEIVFELVIIYLEPNKLILGKHSPEHYDKALSKYRELWDEGELLNDFGHVNYSDSHTEMDERSIVQLDLKDEDL
jgi:hypothetical protein